MVTEPTEHPTPMGADVLAGVRRELRDQLRQRVDARGLATAPRTQRRVHVRDEALSLLRASGAILPQRELTRMVNEVSDEVVGFGPIEFLLQDPEVTEVMVAKDPPLGYRLASLPAVPALSSRTCRSGQPSTLESHPTSRARAGIDLVAQASDRRARTTPLPASGRDPLTASPRSFLGPDDVFVEWKGQLHLVGAHHVVERRVRWTVA